MRNAECEMRSEASQGVKKEQLLSLFFRETKKEGGPPLDRFIMLVGKIRGYW